MEREDQRGEDRSWPSPKLLRRAQWDAWAGRLMTALQLFGSELPPVAEESAGERALGIARVAEAARLLDGNSQNMYLRLRLLGLRLIAASILLARASSGSVCWSG
ncbi:hypothetical protein ACQPXM_17775 [Kribbella sp. CA-253562]|uniref:hypothetical protein n=1 Tax=Kribbella sp. CA-253562 TaxID=3239942 RepID=UPI003D92D70A